MNILSKHGEIILDDDLLQSLCKKDTEKNIEENNEIKETKEIKSVTYNLSNKFNSNVFNDKVLNKKLKGLKKLYDFYGTKSFQSPYEIIMNKNKCKNGKRARMYRLVYKQNDSSGEYEDNMRKLCPTLLGSISDSESENRQSRVYARSEASEDLIKNNHETQTESLNPRNTKRISPQEPTSSIEQANKNIMNNINEFNDKELDIEFNGLKELYKFYGTKSFPPSLKIKESKPTINNKRIRKYKLA